MVIVVRSIQFALFVAICYTAYSIRLHAVTTYGPVIHEFDPYFNLRATEYLVNNGWSKFINWYDSESWYPLGRPVGTTIYPGLQMTSAVIHYALNKWGYEISVNDVCVMVPAWFSVVTTTAIFLLAKETSRSINCGLVAAYIMAIIPAHIMRSVAGGYDNESIAVGALCMTFFLWVRSLRTNSSWPIGILTALSYTYMVAAWGGYVFVLNMIGVHAAIMGAFGFLGATSPEQTLNLHKAYSLFYVFGTVGAIQFPVVGTAPLRSLEQLGPMAVFFGLQLLAFFARHRLTHAHDSPQKLRMFEFRVIFFSIAVGILALFLLLPKGYLGPVSARVRGLFVEHTRTGNPLVDSVAEHQATQNSLYHAYFHHMCLLAPLGIFPLLYRPTPAKIFMLSYTLAAAYFSRKMVRLVLLLSPGASVLGGMSVGLLIEWSVLQLALLAEIDPDLLSSFLSFKPAERVGEAEEEDDSKKKDKKARKPTKKPSYDPLHSLRELYEQSKVPRYVFAGLFLFFLVREANVFSAHSHAMAQQLSHPSIIMDVTTRDGNNVRLDDFREAYWWIRDNTPQDARVMSWWDYGYQIAHIANRTTLADGNTWNHEHIALLGKALVSPVEDAHKIVRHLADYVLVWSTQWVGMMGDDIAKSPHMARIGGSVYSDINPNAFYMDMNRRPSEMMRKSLVYTLVKYRLDPSVPEFPAFTFKEVYTTSNRMVRVYEVLRVSKKSKKYCSQNLGYQAWLEGKKLEGAYPPGLRDILAGKKDFAQLEDFNAER